MRNWLRSRLLAALVMVLVLLCAPLAWAQSGLVSIGNSTTTVLTSGAVFTGASEDVSRFQSVSVIVYADQVSAAGGLSLQYAQDNTNWNHAHAFTIAASTSTIETLPVEAQYFRVVYTNGGVNQGAFRLQTIYHATMTQEVDAGGNHIVSGSEANNVAPVGNPLQLAGYSMTDGSAPSATTAGNVTRLLTTRDGRLIVATDQPKRFSCTVVNNAATALTALGGSCAAPGAGLSLYITDINASASAASTTTADQQLELKSGTGGTCGTGTVVVWNQYAAALTSVVSQFITPIKVAANSELCWMMAAAGSKSFIVNGYIAP